MWYLYLLRLSDDSLYCGITKDLERRLKQHRNGWGSKYVKGRLPLELVYVEELGSRSEAMKRESEIKKWSKKKKEKLAQTWKDS